MRPDAHKRKKNAVYKKKHGIGKEENVDEDSDNQDRKDSNQASAQSEDNDRRLQPKDQRQKRDHRGETYSNQDRRDNQASAKSEDNDRRLQPKDQRQKRDHRETDSSRNYVEPKKESNDAADDAEEDDRSHLFARRKIVSNWSRYEDTPDESPLEAMESKTKLRGADFGSLIQLGANAASQFRLKEEKEWDMTIEPETGIDLLSLDCNSLVNRLQVLPLHQRLNIDEKAFDGETLQIFLEAAGLNTGSHSKKFFTSFKPDPSNILKTLADRSDQIHEENITLSPQVSSNNQKLFLPENLDDELDSLLNLDIPTSISKTSVAPKFSKSLEKREKISRPPRTSSTTVNPIKSVSKTESSDSYDWLDSILD